MVVKKKNKRSSSSSNEIEESKKTRKRDEGEGGGGGINSLSDSILHHVLSFLTMEQAIQTCLVSKRWRYLWTCLPTLNFTKINGKEKQEFVNAALLLRDIRSNIQRFSITDSFDYSHYYHSAKKPNLRLSLNIWIHAAIRRNVEEIHLEFCFSGSVIVELPHCLFTCNSLTKLELISLDSKNMPPRELILPNSISLPSLRILHIERFTPNHHEEGDFKINYLLSNSSCPALESLTLNECGIQTKNLNIVAHNLKHLVINENALSKKQQGMKHGGVRLYAPNLFSFHCKDYLSKSYCLENVSSLVEAYIDMKIGKEKKNILKKGRQVMIRGKKMINFKILHNVKHLQLSAWALQIFISTYGSSDSASTEFHNLRSLELETWLSEDCIRGITCLLNISPNIVKLSVKRIEDTITPVFPQWDEIKLNPADIGDYLKLPLHCMLDHLKYVEIRGLMGTVNELKFLEVLLKNAVVLEELTVGFSPDKYFREKQLIKYSKILHSFPRASSSASILFIS